MESIYPKRIVGTILLNPEYWLEAQQVIITDLPPNLRPIWIEIGKHYDKDILTDRAVLESLREQDILNTLGEGDLRGEEFYVDVLISADEKLFAQAVEKVVDNSMHLKLQDIAGHLRNDALNGTPADNIIEKYIDELDNTHRNAAKQLTIGTIDPKYAERMASLRRGEKSTNWLPTIPSLASKIGMVDRAEFIVVAGDTGGGKSSILRAEAINTALAGDPVLTFDGEGNTEWYKRYSIAYLSTLEQFKGLHLNTTSLKNPKKMTDEEWERFNELNDVLLHIPWIIEPITSVRKMEMIAKQTARRYKGLTLVQIDQIQNLVDKNEVGEIETVTYALRGMAGHLQIPVMAAHQFRKKSKEESKTSTRRPGMDDLLYAGARAASMGILIWRQPMPESKAKKFPENLNRMGGLLPEEDWGAYVIKLVIAKSSGGTTGITDDIAWRRAFNRFDPLDMDWAKPESHQEINSSAGNREVTISVPTGVFTGGRPKSEAVRDAKRKEKEDNKNKYKKYKPPY